MSAIKSSVSKKDIRLEGKGQAGLREKSCGMRNGYGMRKGKGVDCVIFFIGLSEFLDCLSFVFLVFLDCLGFERGMDCLSFF